MFRRTTFSKLFSIVPVIVYIEDFTKQNIAVVYSAYEIPNRNTEQSTKAIEDCISSRCVFNVLKISKAMEMEFFQRKAPRKSLLARNLSKCSFTSLKIIFPPTKVSCLSAGETKLREKL